MVAQNPKSLWAGADGICLEESWESSGGEHGNRARSLLRRPAESRGRLLGARLRPPARTNAAGAVTLSLVRDCF